MISFSTEANKLTERKVIYGEDDRIFTELEANIALIELARSTAAMVRDDLCTTNADKQSITIKGTPLKNTFNNVCDDEKFANTITASVCSGFLVGKDLLVTAGHCIKTLSDCQRHTWVFDFRNDLTESNKEFVANKNQLYKCTKIINRKLDNISSNDFALVKLDREVIDRSPLKFRQSGEISVGTELVVIGHPSGLPSIVSAGATVRNNKSKWFFQSNLDTFGGNSGSAVINLETLEVEGILVRGESDYKQDAKKFCKRVYRCDNDNCRGEDVTRITVIPELVPGMTPVAPVAISYDRNNIFNFNN